ncbi:SLC45 family MFS transporter [Muribaculum caecicola]|uniref:SLC45 family MFS transporter n=1 Tax=Muribaculum caecicola TaxID=3038144 RepID=A0AC61S6J2_9BACT|nr:MFS transporter [Muribaculum caecicola]THG52540.1 SLC45 family MFS transporter [Muribaculum caecicola]
MGTKTKPDLGFWSLWNLSFGFFGVQIAYALQSANISRIFATLGADPHSLSYFWILPPLAGLIIQPIVGSLSDRTWNRFGRRLPYLLFGAILAVIVMALLPNAGAFHFAISGALIFGACALMFLDLSINISMQPFKMLVGDMVNEKQKGLAYSILSFLCNAGSVVGFIFPFVLAAIGISNVADGNKVPDTVTFSFYGGALILIACVIYTFVKVKEMPPKQYAEYHGIDNTPTDKKEKSDFISLLIKAPKVFWTVGLVQFFCWAAFMYMWTYNAGAIAEQAYGWNQTQGTQVANYQEAANWNGILFAIQAVGSVIWAAILPRFKNRRMAYSLSLLIGGIGFISTIFLHDKWLLFISYFLVGTAWAAMLAMPFTILTNSISGKHMGAYLGLFNGTITIPQIVAAVLGGTLFSMLGGTNQTNMIVLAGILLIIGAACVFAIKETYAEAQTNTDKTPVLEDI